jgi:eukaryotic-like serine/threonine-protein kinase
MQIGPYELLRELGRGGMGVVYAARDTKLGRKVAIKFLLEASGQIADRFMIEARATAQCTHENIVVIHEVDDLAGLPFMVLEHLDGESLRVKLAGGPLSPGRVVEIALAMARALARAGELDIVHRDLKPENVFITSGGPIKVLDFGIAKARFAVDPRASGPILPRGSEAALTTAGALIGTLPYMSPEQLAGQDVDVRSDLWAVGVMMFEMLAGRHPVEPLTPEKVIDAVAGDEPMPRLSTVVPDAPAALVKLVDHCLRKRTAERMPSAVELVRRLEELLPRHGTRALAEDECPYPGLAAFQEADADRFFGRQREIARMVAQVRDRPLTAVIGASGAGKSSFVRAGVVPALQMGGEPWEAVTIRPGRQPLEVLASLLERHGEHDADRDALVERLRREPGYFGSVMRRWCRTTRRQLALFVDQFEELYTLVGDVSVRAAFTAALSALADDAAAPVRVIIAMRTDLLDRLAEDRRFADEVARSVFVLGPIDRDSLREALSEPATRAGYRFESEAMVDEMLADLAATAGALPLLQFAASKLWDARDRQRHLLTLASYHESGGVSGSLAVHADQVLAAMDASSRQLARRALRQLVTPERTRAIVELADLEQLSPDRQAVRRVIDQLVAARLLVVQARSESESATVEIVHESLIERWPTLARWLDEEQEDAAFVAQVGSSAKQWDARGRAPGLLWRGEAIADARRWFRARPRELGAREQAFLDAGFALERRGKRTRRAALIGAFVALAAVAGGAWVAYIDMRASRERADRALAAQRSEEGARRVAEANKTAALAALLTEEQRRAAAESGLLSAAQVLAAAEASLATAEARARAAEAERIAAETERQRLATEQAVTRSALVRTEQSLDTARTDKINAERAARERAAEVQLSREELIAALASARAAREKAERATARAEFASADAEKARRALEQALAVERARVQRLEDEKRKLSTQLR